MSQPSTLEVAKGLGKRSQSCDRCFQVRLVDTGFPRCGDLTRASSKVFLGQRFSSKVDSPPHQNQIQATDGQRGKSTLTGSRAPHCGCQSFRQGGHRAHDLSPLLRIHLDAGRSLRRKGTEEVSNYRVSEQNTVKRSKHSTEGKAVQPQI